jgi:hypothetical protein
LVVVHELSTAAETRIQTAENDEICLNT